MSLARVDFFSAVKGGKFLKQNGDPMNSEEALSALWATPTAFHEYMGKWLKLRGFKKWFSRPPVTELARMSGLLVEKSMERLYEIMTNDDPKMSTTQVTAARLIFEMARVMPDKKENVVVSVDKQIAAMSDDEKRALIKKAAQLQELEASDE